MKKKNAVFLCMLTAIVFSFVSFFVTSFIIKSSDKGRVYVGANEYDELMRYFELDDIKETLKDEYIREIDENIVIEGALKGSVNILDDGYSKLYLEEDFKWFDQSAEGSYIGQGITFERDETTGWLVVKNVYGDTAAYDANVLKGDIITAIDGRDTREIDVENAIARLRGQAGTEVTLCVLDENNESIEISFVRRIDDIQLAFYDMLTKNIGYLSVIEFGTNCPQDFENAIESLNDNNAKQVILDLRGVYGGYISSAVKCADMLLAGGRIANQYNREGDVASWSADNSTLWEGNEIVLLTDENTAGCAEVFAAALAENGAAVLMGNKTAGKGYTTKYIELPSCGDGLRIISGGYSSPMGTDLAKEGIMPEMEITEEAKDNSDIVLQRAIEYLEG